MTVVSDAGPLIAFAKIGALDTLRSLHAEVLVPPAVFREAIEEGLLRGEPDAKDLSQYLRAGGLRVVPLERASPLSSRWGAGERECFELAIEQQADWLLIDDWDARQEIEKELRNLGRPTQFRGTLGLLVAAQAAGNLSGAQAAELVLRLRQRPDIWISPELCDRVLATLARES